MKTAVEMSLTAGGWGRKIKFGINVRTWRPGDGFPFRNLPRPFSAERSAPGAPAFYATDQPLSGAE